MAKGRNSSYQSKVRRSMRNQLTYEERMRVDALFDKIESDMGIPQTEFRKKQLERMVNNMHTTKNNSSSRFCRGEIYYVVPENEIAKSEAFVGGRPAIIVSNDMNNEMNGVLEVVYLTRHPRGKLPTNVQVMATGQASTAICDQIYTVSKNRVGKYVGQLSIGETKKVDEALILSLALSKIDKNIAVNILESWRNELSENHTDVQINQIEERDDALLAEIQKEETLVISDSGTKSDVNCEEVDISDIEKDMESSDDTVVSESVSNIDITTMPEYIRVCAQLEVYKELYLNLLAAKNDMAV